MLKRLATMLARKGGGGDPAAAVRSVDGAVNQSIVASNDSSPRKYVAIDCETTGLNIHQGNRIVSLGLVAIDDAFQIVDQRYYIFNPERRSDRSAVRVHQLSFWYLKHQELFAQRADEIRAFLGDAELVGHNVAFDVNFLNNEFLRVGAPLLDAATHCTKQMFGLAHPGARFRRLDYALEQCGVKVEKGVRDERHNALADAALSLDLFAHLRGEPSPGFDYSKLAPHNECHVPEPPIPSDRSREAVARRGKRLKPHQAYEAYETYGSQFLAAKVLGVSIKSFSAALKAHQ